ncbi:hypothetical protein [Kitasatospora sp. LaBMicrA B282]|uniref:hypothetical protein n=1 Tax=Kitasatospora sp. LaBMicrA B282 TaxID=3420949 RepID=UPI003D107229
MSNPDRLHIAYSMYQFADETWTARAERWTATFYTPSDPEIGSAEITRVIPGVTPDPRRALEADPGLLDRIPRVIFAEDGSLVPAVAEAGPTLLLLLESVHVTDQWRGKGVGMSLAVAALRRLAVPGALAVCYPAPIHDHGPDEPCSYASDDPEVRRPDEEAIVKLRRAWARHGFRPIGDGVYVLRLE